MARQRTPLTDEQRARKREEDRQYVQQAVEELRSSAGWQRWLSTRSRFRTYSLTNQLLIANQRPTAVKVAGFRAWLALGHCVKKGETALWIWANRALSHQMRSPVFAASVRPGPLPLLLSVT